MAGSISGPMQDEPFTADEIAFGVENLDAIVHGIADVEIALRIDDG